MDLLYRMIDLFEYALKKFLSTNFSFKIQMTHHFLEKMTLFEKKHNFYLEGANLWRRLMKLI